MALCTAHTRTWQNHLPVVQKAPQHFLLSVIFNTTPAKCDSFPDSARPRNAKEAFFVFFTSDVGVSSATKSADAYWLWLSQSRERLEILGRTTNGRSLLGRRGVQGLLEQVHHHGVKLFGCDTFHRVRLQGDEALGLVGVVVETVEVDVACQFVQAGQRADRVDSQGLIGAQRQ